MHFLYTISVTCYVLALYMECNIWDYKMLLAHIQRFVYQIFILYAHTPSPVLLLLMAGHRKPLISGG